MKINELIQTGTRTEEYTAIVPSTYDNNGNILTETHSETQTREVPIMTAVTRDMTDEEIGTLHIVETPAESPNALTEMATALSIATSLAQMRDAAKLFLNSTGGI